MSRPTGRFRERRDHRVAPISHQRPGVPELIVRPPNSFTRQSMKPKFWFTALSLPALFVLVEASDNTLWGNHVCLLVLLLMAVLALASTIHGLCVLLRQWPVGLVHLTLVC